MCQHSEGEGAFWAKMDAEDRPAMTTQTDTPAIRPPCDCIEDNAPCHHGPRHCATAQTDTAQRSAFSIRDAVADDGFTCNHFVWLTGRDCGPVTVAKVPKEMGRKIVALSARVAEMEALRGKENATDMDRAEIVTRRAVNLGWVDEKHADDLLRTIRVALRYEAEAAEARATQAEAERDALTVALYDATEGISATLHAGEVDALNAALSASQAREAGMREALTDVMTWIGNWAPNFIYDEEWDATEHKVNAALSPAQPAQDRIAAASAFIDRNGPTPGADRFEGPEVSGPDGLVNGQWPPLVFGYTNWRGEHGTRRAIPIRVYHDATEYHTEPQWLMEAHDLDKGAVRVFAMRDMGPAQGADIARELAVVVDALLKCPEIADAAPEDVDEETRVVERQARKLLARARSAGLLTTETEVSNG